MNVKKLQAAIVLLAILATSCSKIDYSINPNASIVGEWGLIKTCFSDGSSECNKKDLEDPTIDRGLTFTGTGEFEIGTGSVLQTGTYFVSDENLVELTIEFPESSLGNSTLQIRRLTEDEMILNPLCSDPCVYLYKKY